MSLDTRAPRRKAREVKRRRRAQATTRYSMCGAGALPSGSDPGGVGGSGAGSSSPRPLGATQASGSRDFSETAGRLVNFVLSWILPRHRYSTTSPVSSEGDGDDARRNGGVESETPRRRTRSVARKKPRAVRKTSSEAVAARQPSNSATKTPTRRSKRKRYEVESVNFSDMSPDGRHYMKRSRSERAIRDAEPSPSPSSSPSSSSTSPVTVNFSQKEKGCAGGKVVDKYEPHRPTAKATSADYSRAARRHALTAKLRFFVCVDR